MCTYLVQTLQIGQTKQLLNYRNSGGIFRPSPRDIRAKMIFLGGSFALFPRVFPTLNESVCTSDFETAPRYKWERPDQGEEDRRMGEQTTKHVRLSADVKGGQSRDIQQFRECSSGSPFEGVWSKCLTSCSSSSGGSVADTRVEPIQPGVASGSREVSLHRC